VLEAEKTGKICARMTSDIDSMQEFICDGLVLFVQNIFLFIGAVVFMLVLSWELALGVLVIVPPLFFASRWFRRVSNKAYLEVRDSISTNLTTLQEGLEGVRVVQAYGRTRSFTDRCGRTNEAPYPSHLDTAATIRERPRAAALPSRGEIDVDAVPFAYGTNEPVLHDVSLHVSSGERLALVGPTGAGKSTLAKLIARFYDPTAGAVRVDGVDLRDVTMESLRKRVAVVPAEGFLFG